MTCMQVQLAIELKILYDDDMLFSSDYVGKAFSTKDKNALWKSCKLG